MTSLEELVLRCKKDDVKAQYELYERYKSTLFAIARRYLKDQHLAEDIFVHSMYKIFTKIQSYTGPGSFEGWMKKIVVNECLMQLRKPIHKQHFVEVQGHQHSYDSRALDRLKEHDLLALLDQLPEGYKTVFNLYVIEGYKHAEIAEMLNISISTSKSQLFLARKKLQSILLKNEYDGPSL